MSPTPAHPSIPSVGEIGVAFMMNVPIRQARYWILEGFLPARNGRVAIDDVKAFAATQGVPL